MTESSIFTDENEKTAAVLAGVRLPGSRNFSGSMKELEALAEACGIETEMVFEQRLDHPDHALFIGRGKAEEIRDALKELDCRLVIFNNTLSPSQQSNLSDALDAEVIDRTGLILNIFAIRARTGEAKLQVEYAQLRYMLPRLVGLRKNLSRQGGTAGSMSNRGAGEKKIELDRRRIEDRMAFLRRRLAGTARGRSVRSSRRERSGIPRVALVGYTNAGKSTLMNTFLDRLGAEEEKLVRAEDMLFATLDTSVRKIRTGGGTEFLLSDTVGFISDLPAQLVDAFRSTLDEALDADLILHVADCSDPLCSEHMDVTEQTLADLGAGAVPVITVMNKADLAADCPEIPLIRGDRIWMSAKDGSGFDELVDMIIKKLSGGDREVELLIPYAESSRLYSLRREAAVTSCSYEDDAIRVRARIAEKYLSKYRDLIIP
jgi:GTP-binding protein HflX